MKHNDLVFTERLSSVISQWGGVTEAQILQHILTMLRNTRYQGFKIYVNLDLLDLYFLHGK